MGIIVHGSGLLNLERPELSAFSANGYSIPVNSTQEDHKGKWCGIPHILVVKPSLLSHSYCLTGINPVLSIS